MPDGVKEGTRRAETAAPACRALDIGHPFLRAAVIVVIQRDSMVETGLDERVAQWVPPGQVVNFLRAGAATVAVVASADLAFQPHEIAEHIRIGPPPVAELCPDVEIGRLATVEHQPVDGTRPAKHPPARDCHRPSLGPPAAACLVQPVHRGVFQQIHEPGGYLNHRVGVGGPGLQKADADRPVLAQPVGQNAAGGSGTDDDVVVAISHIWPPPHPALTDNQSARRPVNLGAPVRPVIPRPSGFRRAAS